MVIIISYPASPRKIIVLVNSLLRLLWLEVSDKTLFNFFDFLKSCGRCRRKKSVKRCAPCKLNKTIEESEPYKKLFVNTTGKISSKVVFIVEKSQETMLVNGKIQTLRT